MLSLLQAHILIFLLEEELSLHVIFYSSWVPVCFPFISAYLCRFLHFLVQESLVSEEIMHNLDTCEVTVLGEELNQEQESLEIDMTRLQQKGIEMSSSNLGMIITGGGSCSGGDGDRVLDRWFGTDSRYFGFDENVKLRGVTTILWKAVILENTSF